MRNAGHDDFAENASDGDGRSAARATRRPAPLCTPGRSLAAEGATVDEGMNADRREIIIISILYRSLC